MQIPGGIGGIYVVFAFGSAPCGSTTGVCKIMGAAALEAWQVGASRTWSMPPSPLGRVDILADCDGLPHAIRADKLIATACMNPRFEGIQSLLPGVVLVGRTTRSSSASLFALNALTHQLHYIPPLSWPEDLQF